MYYVLFINKSLRRDGLDVADLIPHLVQEVKDQCAGLELALKEKPLTPPSAGSAAVCSFGAPAGPPCAAAVPAPIPVRVLDNHDALRGSLETMLHQQLSDGCSEYVRALVCAVGREDADTPGAFICCVVVCFVVSVRHCS